MKLETLGYSALNLDRCGNQRDADAFVLDLLRDHATLFVPVWRNKNLVTFTDSEPEAVLLTSEHIPSYLVSDYSKIFLGVNEGKACFAIDVSKLDFAPRIIDKSEFVDLRQVGQRLSAKSAALLAYARALTYSLREQGFCCRCGNKNKVRLSGHVQVCPSCHYETYPRVNPAVIVLVESVHADTEEAVCLLGRHKGLPKGAYSTLAGFVEPGESLEAAVQREVYEEAGIDVSEVNYLGSQPWPFPSSIMIGFRASGCYRPVPQISDELEDARWFTREQIRQFGEWGENSEFTLSRSDSIARTLVKHWLECESI